jgi:hypothetical protein
MTLILNNQSLAEHEVLLGSYRLPISGRVQMVKLNDAASKITIGKTTRADQIIADEWIQDDWRDGLLVYQLDEQTQQGRFWWSTSETRYKKKICLPPLVTSIGNATASFTAPDHIVDFNNQIFVSFGGKIHTWDDVTSTWSAELEDVGAPVIDSIVYKNKLYLSTGNDYWEFDPNPAIGWTQIVEPMYYFCQFDVNPEHKLVGINGSGEIKASIDGQTWSTDIGATIHDVTPTDILPYRDYNDEPILLVATDKGLVGADLWTATNYFTSLQILINPDAGKGSTVWSDSNLYFTDGLAVWRYPRTGQITNVGLDRDDSIPTIIRGKITRLTNTPNYLIATIDATKSIAVGTESVFLGAFWGTFQTPDMSDVGYSAIMAWNGNGWHTLYMSEYSGMPITATMLSTAYNNERRLFFADNNEVKYIPLREGNYDPTQDANATFAETSIFETSWFDADFSEIEKVASSIKFRCLNITNTEEIDIYYAINDVETYTLVDTIDSNNTNSKGMVVLPLNPVTSTNREGGLAFYSIKFRFILRRGTDTTKTPVILFFDMRYRRTWDSSYGWTFTVVDSDMEKLENLHAVVEELANKKSVLPFAYRANETRDKLVQVQSISGVEYTGTENTASFTLTVVEPDASLYD